MLLMILLGWWFAVSCGRSSNGIVGRLLRRIWFVGFVHYWKVSRCGRNPAWWGCAEQWMVPHQSGTRPAAMEPIRPANEPHVGPIGSRQGGGGGEGRQLSIVGRLDVRGSIFARRSLPDYAALCHATPPRRRHDWWRRSGSPIVRGWLPSVAAISPSSLVKGTGRCQSYSYYL